MTSLEQQALADGFRIGLLAVDADRARDALAFRATLFDGGRAHAVVEARGRYFAPDADAVARLRSLLLGVAAPPAVLVAAGRGWQPLLTQVLPPVVVAALRVLDLGRTAMALVEGLRPGASPAAVAAAYGLRGVAETDAALESALHEDLLWAVLARAGGAGLTWNDLYDASERRRARVAYEKYAFDQAAIDTLPAEPGVYVMHDLAGHAIYVGKAANLARRLKDYFTRTTDMPPKLREIRDRIFDFRYERVGSELEALLLENRLIDELQPAINVQRRVAEEAGRYGALAAPVAIVCGAAAAGIVALFLTGARGRAVQCNLRPARLPLARLRALLEVYLDEERRWRLPRGATDWGEAGHAIASRYFQRVRDRLNWTELAGNAAAATARVAGVMARVAERPDEPAEFRGE